MIVFFLPGFNLLLGAATEVLLREAPIPGDELAALTVVAASFSRQNKFAEGRGVGPPSSISLLKDWGNQ